MKGKQRNKHCNLNLCAVRNFLRRKPATVASSLDVKYVMTTVVPSDLFGHQIALVQRSRLWFYPRYNSSEGRGAGFPRDVFSRLPGNVVPPNVDMVLVSIDIFDVKEEFASVTQRVLFAVDRVRDHNEFLRFASRPREVARVVRAPLQCGRRTRPLVVGISTVSSNRIGVFRRISRWHHAAT